ncbi:DUF1573 domain-containing protein [Ferruginibacter paludis]|uniref:DUF1573 domain-containing protein n=1 Tax=Ferruginibacter paludis TaxID=1310417 RepID=UPI0025B5E5F4|nr:DUF1573 domain-containing protein [Ferruginibacter paludis]MDN3658540.1 DUF1573 domain-containing protein [Ferruginibacter paludis]
MKKVFTLAVVCFAALYVHAQSTDLGKNTPKQPSSLSGTTTVPAEILGLKETAFDFGKIPQGRPVTHIFEVINNGKDSLKISNVQASCGCTTPDWDRNKVQAPKEKTAITVGYNAASEGPFTKIITITYNGTETKQITITGEVWKTPATSAPENKELGILKDL